MTHSRRRNLLSIATALLLLGACGGGSSSTSSSGIPATAGGRLLFVSDLEGGFAVYSMKPDGTDLQKVTSKEGSFEPAWSPDGRRIAYMLNRDEGDEGGVYVMNADGTADTQVACCGDGGLAWSPDGTAIVFRRVSPPTIGLAVWQEGKVRALTTERTPDGYDTNPTWSPDGTRIAYASADSAFEFSIWVTQADGSGQATLLRSSAQDPAWSPDGTHIAFSSTVGDNTDVYVINPDGTNVIRLTDNTAADASPAWSPDGTRIAFASNRSGNLEIFVMNADGSGQTQLTNNGAQNMMPSWGP